MRILMIEDDADTAEIVCSEFREHGYDIAHEADGREGLRRAMSETWDVIIADRTLPGMEGLSIVKTLRASGDATPILVLSALGEVVDRVDGLQAGGDDYLPKPYAFVELLARVEALLRRGARGADTPTRLEVADLKLDLVGRRAERGAQAIDLTGLEFRLLEYLMRHSGQVVSRKMLLESIWGMHFDPETNLVEVHMSRLRKVVDKGFAEPLIHTVRGEGYVVGPRRERHPGAPVEPQG
ncbi:MAG: response regulator transcription factor [Steroidobacteraceae bacterium]